jgi:hypothetical protein
LPLFPVPVGRERAGIRFAEEGKGDISDPESMRWGMINGDGSSVGVDALYHIDLDGEVLEMPLLLPRWQVVALEMAAQERGLSTAAMLRTVLCDYLMHQKRERMSIPSLD